MIMWVVDTCVIIDIISGDGEFSTVSADAIDAKREAGLVIAPIQYQDTRTHYDKGYRWWTLGHAKDGTKPDEDDEAWEIAESNTVEFVKQWTKSCQLTNECTCAWGKK